MIAVDTSIKKPPNHCNVVSLFPKRARERITEVTGSMRLINADLEGPIFEMPMKNVVAARTVHTSAMVTTQNHPAKLQFK